MIVSVALPFIMAIAAAGAEQEFPSVLVDFTPGENNPVFQGAGPGHWDERIRERGWILLEDGLYHMWYTGYDSSASPVMKMGYATSPDGLAWTRYEKNPVYAESWIEDVMVIKREGKYYMFAEGENDRAKLLTSTDRVNWTLQNNLDIRKVNGNPLDPGPFGTPTAWYENGKWYLFYERDDEAIWLATSTDLKIFTNVQDDPVIKRGPELYDKIMLALNQIVKYDGRYYAYYHGTGPLNGPDDWTTNVAVSDDLIHWKKYPANPILGDNKSSGFLVHDGATFRMYTMHPAVCVHSAKENTGPEGPLPK